MSARVTPITGNPIVLRMQLVHVTPVVHRTIAVPGNVTLQQLHTILQAAMGWQNRHLHQFMIAGARYGVIDPEGFDQTMLSEQRVRLAGALKGTDRFTYVYDFGDWWEHDIEIVTDHVIKPSMRLPRCIDGANACPPEDVGGPPGYEAFVQVMADTKHPMYWEAYSWNEGRHFKPEAFSVSMADRRLAALKR